MFFSVNTSMKIMGKVYSPCICYKLTKELSATIEKLESEGKAKLYAEKVAFQNGKVLVKATPVVEKKTKKAKKEAEETIKEEDVGEF